MTRSEGADAPVVIIGAGVAGAAAAIATASQDRPVVVLDGGSGASTLATGAIDCVTWRSGARPRETLSDDALDALDALDAFALPTRGATLLTTAGVVRPARGYDTAILDLASLAETNAAACVGVLACTRPGWDALSLSRAWNDAGVVFSPFHATVLRHTDESHIPDVDFASRHDDDARLGWLSDRLRDALARGTVRYDALVFPPMLGLTRARAQALSARVGIPCGEALGMPGGPSGLRFQHARDRAFTTLAIQRHSSLATAIERCGAVWRVTHSEGEPIDACAVVLATGGLIGGGLSYAPGEAAFASAFPAEARAPLRLTLSAPFPLGTHGRPLEAPGSLFGRAPESLAWPFERNALLDRVGVLDESCGESDPSALSWFAAGDVVADGPRSWLGALASGARAGALAGASRGGARSTANLPRRRWRDQAPASRP